jgi:hypothetical protein
LVALTFLVAHLGAEAHAYSHLSGDLHGLPGGGQSCGTCLSAAPLFAAADGSPSILLVQHFEVAPSVAVKTTSIPWQPLHRAFQSRAPPALL